ncbi:uncharacterized protein [Littorina saxatilis]|uniref:RING-type domain-containing protein n=1 Tax=Littorina saxatilis TaxID=31220 RepID=A0AAN9AXH2_9CAEN
MILTLGLGLGGIVLATSVGLASVVVKAYSCAPASLLITLRHLFDFLFALTEVFCKMSTVVLLFIYNVASHFLGFFFDVLPGFVHFISTMISFLLWVFVHIIRGLLGLETKAMNTLSWLIAICALFLYIENKYQDIGVNFFVNGRLHLSRVLLRNRHAINDGGNYNTVNNNVAVVNEETEVDPEQLQENQQLEIENRENENEENALEEADRNRVNIDNVQNDQREMDRAEQARPPRFLPDDDSSDDDIDPNMCSVCLHRARGAALFPCGHTQLCRICARIIIAAQRPCPMCQTPIQEFRNVYV